VFNGLYAFWQSFWLFMHALLFFSKKLKQKKRKADKYV